MSDVNSGLADSFEWRRPGGAAPARRWWAVCAVVMAGLIGGACLLGSLHIWPLCVAAFLAIPVLGLITFVLTCLRWRSLSTSERFVSVVVTAVGVEVPIAALVCIGAILSTWSGGM
jgi:hypothetical protein